MNKDFYEKKLKSFCTFLSRWQADIVQIEQVGGHGVNIIVCAKDKRGALRICCINPVEAHGVLRVIEADLKLDYMDGNFVLSDEAKNFKIICRNIEFKEYLK